MDSQQYQQFHSKLEGMPDEVSYYFDSEALYTEIKSLAEKHQAPRNEVSDLLSLFFINDFDRKTIDDFAVKTFQSEDTRNAFVLDFWGKILLPLDHYLPTLKAKDFIVDQEGDDYDYLEYEDSLKTDYENHIFDLIDKRLDKFVENFDIKGESQIALNVFSQGLLLYLEDNSEENIAVLNGALVYLLINNFGLKDELIKALSDNQENITKNEIMLSGKVVKGSIENWLKDLFQKSGGGNFDNLKMTEYLTNSENTKKLSAEEREVLGTLFKTYRNLRYFPESMNGLPPEQWYIIPMAKSEQEEQEDEVVEVVPAVGAPEPVNVPEAPPEPAPIPVNPNANRLAELNDLANRYAPGSMERRAIEEEIGKLGQ
ncbi:hypothetical protein HGA64_00775 [Candidatus Falkowbacteria bacterium]|nr:hypothetical protein [Candidatus Falkowbacteria bacterium]